jgi:hypothetical protein
VNVSVGMAFELGKINLWLSIQRVHSPTTTHQGRRVQRRGVNPQPQQQATGAFVKLFTECRILT